MTEPISCSDNWSMLNDKFGSPRNTCANGKICSWRLKGGRYILYSAMGDQFMLFRTKQEFDDYWGDRLLEALNDRRELELKEDKTEYEDKNRH